MSDPVPSPDRGGDAPTRQSAPDATPRPSWWASFTRATIPLPSVLIAALLGPAVVAVMIALVEPHRTWKSFLGDVVGAGWLGPLLVVCISFFVRARLEVAHRRATTTRTRLHTLALCLLAARVRHYQDLGTGDPLAAATHDLAAYVADTIPRHTAASWEFTALHWYGTAEPGRWLPPIPKDVIRSVARDAHARPGASDVG